MTDEQSFDEDPQLRALLGQSDPARSLTPADPQGLARLLEDTMATPQHDLDTRTDLPSRAPSCAAEVRSPGSSPRRPSPPSPEAATPPSRRCRTTGPSSRPARAPSPVDEPVVVTLEAPTTLPAKCAVPTPELLGTAEVAFAGTVTAVDGDIVTLAPTETYAGQAADEVEVVGMLPDLRGLGQPEFVVGGTYLVSATGGQVSACGFSGEASPRAPQPLRPRVPLTR